MNESEAFITQLCGTKFQLLQACLRGEKMHILKMTLPQKNSPRIKTPYPYLMNLVSNYLEKNILSDTVKINGIQSRMSLKLRIKIVAFFLGHPVCVVKGSRVKQL